MHRIHARSILTHAVVCLFLVPVSLTDSSPQREKQGENEGHAWKHPADTQAFRLAQKKSTERSDSKPAAHKVPHSLRGLESDGSRNRLNGKRDHDLKDDKMGEAVQSSEEPSLADHHRKEETTEPFVEQREVHLPGHFPETSGMRSLVSGDTNRPIPKIFHQIYLNGTQALASAMTQAESSSERLPVNRAWRESCEKLHPEWEFRIWNASAMESLIRMDYPWFLETYLSYPRDIYRVDAVRPFILDKYGGMYVDLDTECFRPVEDYLQGHELILQEEDRGATSLVNSAIAGVPGLHFWQIWQKVLKEKAHWLKMAIQSPHLRRDWEVVAVIDTTGPWALRAAFRAFTKDSNLTRNNFIGPWIIDGTRVMVYPGGSWYIPCHWSDKKCHNLVESMHEKGVELPFLLAGHHKFTGSWLRELAPNKGVNWLSSWSLIMYFLLVVAVLVWRS